MEYINWKIIHRRLAMEQSKNLVHENVQFVYLKNLENNCQLHHVIM